MAIAVQNKEIKELFQKYGSNLIDVFHEEFVRGKYKELQDKPAKQSYFSTLIYAETIFRNLSSSLCIITDPEKDSIIETLSKSLEWGLSRNYHNNMRVINLNRTPYILKKLQVKYQDTLKIVEGQVKEGESIDSAVISPNCSILIDPYSLSSKISTNKIDIEINKMRFDSFWEFLTDPKSFAEKIKAIEGEWKRREEGKLKNRIKRMFGRI